MKTFLRRRLSDLKHTTALLTKAARTKAPRLAYVGGWLGHQNLGDEALFAAYKKLFPDYGLLMYGPATPPPALRISRWGRICAAGVLAGGTLIGRWDVNKASPILETFPISFVFGTGVANPVFWSSRDSSFGKRLDSWKAILERCCYIGVRGPMSAEVLAGIGLDNVEVVGDPVLVFADRDYTANAGLSTASLGLNVGHSRGKVWGSEESMCEQFVRLAKVARNHGWDVHWFVVWPDDLETTLRAAEASGTTDRVYQIYDDHSRFLDLVRPLTAFVGMKLHAVVLATCAYVPSIMVEYRPKCRDYMRSINQEDVTVRSDGFNGDAAWERVRSWESRLHERRRSLYESIQSLTRLQCAKAEEITRRIMAGEHMVSPEKRLQPLDQIPPLPRTGEGSVE